MLVSKVANISTKTSSIHLPLRLVLLDLGGIVVRNQSYEDIAKESAYIRLHGSTYRQANVNNGESVQLDLKGITCVFALEAALNWASHKTLDIIAAYVAIFKSEPTQIEYLYRLLRLYSVAQKLIMRELQRQILDLFNIEVASPELATKQTVTFKFLSSSLLPSYGMLGMYLEACAMSTHAEYLQEGWPSEDIGIRLIDIMQLLEADLRIRLTKTKLEHKSDISEIAELWRIDLVDDLPHRFSVFPKDVLGPNRQVLGFQREGEDDIEMTDAELLNEDHGFEPGNQNI